MAQKFCVKRNRSIRRDAGFDRQRLTVRRNNAPSRVGIGLPWATVRAAEQRVYAPLELVGNVVLKRSASSCTDSSA
jgi:hypothetical protein